MSKTLYSMMLSEDVVQEVDRLAHLRGTNRSALVNQILAEYVNLMTPERRIREIFRQIGEILDADRELVPNIAPNAQSISLRSSLQVRYRPTVKYSVELYRERGEAVGALTVVFRTQSAALLQSMEEFFRLIARIEDEYVAPRLTQAVRYTLSPGRFTRTLCPQPSVGPQAKQNIDTREAAQAISEYVRLFDRLMKLYIGGADAQTVAQEYLQWLHEGNVIM